MSTKILRIFFSVCFCILLMLPIYLYIGTVVASIGTESEPVLPDFGECSFDGSGYAFPDETLFSAVTELMHPVPDTPLAQYTSALHGFTSQFGCPDYVSFALWYVSSLIILSSILTLLVAIPLFVIRITERWV